MDGDKTEVEALTQSVRELTEAVTMLVQQNGQLMALLMQEQDMDPENGGMDIPQPLS